MRSDGRHSSISTAAAKNRRSATVPKLPTSPNSCLASAEPTWTLTMPSITSAVCRDRDECPPGRRRELSYHLDTILG